MIQAVATMKALKQCFGLWVNHPVSGRNRFGMVAKPYQGEVRGGENLTETI